MMWHSTTGALLVIGAVSIYIFVRKRYRYFEERGIKYVPILPFVGSNWRSLIFQKHMVDELRDNYNMFPDEKYFGIFEGLTPVLVIRDPDIIKRVTVKDADHFIDHRNAFFNDMDDSLFTKAIIFLKGQKWRDMRGTLSPAFTGSKMRMMLPFMTQVGTQVVEYLQENAEKNGNLTEPMELYDLFTRVANDIIASCAFGIKVDSLKNINNEFYATGRSTFNFKKWIFFMFTLFPRLSKLLGISLFTKKSTIFFKNLVSGTMEHRTENNIVRHDMIHLLMEAKSGKLTNTAQPDDGLGFATVQETQLTTTKRHWTDDELAAQAFIFFLAGFETTSTALTFLVHEVTINNEIQTKLRAEIDECHAQNEEITYGIIQRLKYMDMVISESLRKWASAIVIDRQCVKEYTFESPRDGAKPFTMKPNDYLYVYVNALHHDERYFPEPARTDPERFSDERKHEIQPFTYLPFGSGPRNCIGSRFALMELKVILYHLLLNFDLVPCEKTTDPIRLAKEIRFTIQNGSWITFRKRH